jgi:integrase
MFAVGLPAAYRGGTLMRINLTPAFVVKAAAAHGAERTIYWDQNLRGFGLMVTTAGHKSFVVQYRKGRVSSRMTIRNVLSLSDARREAKGVLGEVARGGDPLNDRRKQRAAQGNTLRAVAEEYLKREGKSLRSISQRRSHLERLVFPELGMRQIGDIKRTDITRLLDRIDDESGPVMADTVLAILRRVMGWHAARGDDFRSPIIRGMSRVKPRERARSRILTDDELRQVWTTATEMDGPFPRLIRFLLLTAARRTEAASMTWGEIDGSDWLLPASRNKTKQDHVRPLSKTAQSALAELPRITGRQYVFTADGCRPFASLSRAKRAFDDACGITGWRLHDLRRTARSLLSRAGISADIAERCLGHLITGVRGIYDRHQYRDEMLHAFEALAAQIERIVNPQENVVPMTRPT